MIIDIILMASAYLATAIFCDQMKMSKRDTFFVAWTTGASVFYALQATQ